MLSFERARGALIAGLLLSPLAAAQHVSAVQLSQPPVYAGVYDVSTSTLTPPGPGDSGGSSTLYDNTTGNGSFYAPGTGLMIMDWGTPNFGGGGAVLDAIQVAYATSKATPASLRIRLHQGATGNGGLGTIVLNQLLSGLPGSTNGTPQGFIIDVTLSTPLNVADGAFGWSYQLQDTLTGPLLIGPPNAAGVVNNIDQYTPSTGAYLGTGNFGPTGPFASFHIRLSGRANTPPIDPWEKYGVGNGVSINGSGSGASGSVDSVISLGGTAGKKDVLVIGLNQVDVVGGQFQYNFYVLPWMLVIPDLQVPFIGQAVVNISAPIPADIPPGTEIFFQAFGQAANNQYSKWSRGMKLTVQ